MLNIKINTTDDKFLKVIEFNYEELKTFLNNSLYKYKNLVFTQETMKDGKSTRAELNKLKKVLDDKRKDIKKKCLEPYTEFEKKINELISLIDAPVLVIDNQIKSFENKEKEEKKVELMKFFEEKNFLKNILFFENVFEDKYLNSTFSVLQAKREIDAKILKIKEDYLNLENVFKNDKYYSNIKNAFLKTFDIRDAYNEKIRCDNIEKLEEERKKQEEKKEIIVEEKKEIIVEEKKEIIKEKIFKIKLNKTNFDELISFLQNKNIEFNIE